MDTFKNEKEGEQDFLMSLPVTRAQVVNAKFLSLGLYIIYGIIPAVAFGLLFKIPLFRLSVEYPSALDFFKIITAVLLLTWILPLYFRYGPKMIRILMIILVSLGVLLQVGFMAAVSFKGKGTAGFIDAAIAWFRSIPPDSRRLYSFITALAVAAVSYLLSRMIYRKKDF